MIPRSEHGKHGESAGGGSSEYRSWLKMIQRCTNPRQAGFKNYGGRGIRVHEAWRKSYSAFLADMGRKPSPKHTIDRIDNNGNYEPGNCRWANGTDQRRKTTRSKLTVESAAEIRRRRANGETGTSLAAEFNVDHATVYRIGYGERWA